MRSWFVCGIFLGALLLPASSALAVGGDLELIGCVRDDDSDAACDASSPGLGTSAGGPSDVALSPDARSVYVSSGQGSSIVVLQRDPETGELTPAGCIEDEDYGTGECDATAPGLKYASSVAVGPDGASVYVAGEGAIAHFARAADDGALTPESCVTTDGVQDCEETLDEDLHLGAPIAVSADGKSLYGLGTHSLAAFALGPGGAPEFAECHAATNVPEYPGGGPSAGTCVPSDHGLFGAAFLALSPDDTSLYVVSTGGGDGVGADEIVLFDRDPATGDLSGGECPHGPECPFRPLYPAEPTGVAVIADGSSLFLSTAYQGYNERLIEFRRSPETGGLTSEECFSADEASPCFQVKPLDGLNSIAGVSPDSRSLYTVGDGVHLFRQTPPFYWRYYQGCTAGDSPGCHSDAPFLPSRLEFTADGGTAYGVSPGVLSTWRRELDFDPPATSLDLVRKRRRAWFRIRSDEPGSTFRCRVDYGDWRACVRRVRTRRLKPGEHRFRARAIDPAGNPDPTSVRRDFRINR